MPSLIMPNRFTIQEMRQIAERRGGGCLTDIYVGAHSKLTWQCAKGHQWAATPNNVRRGKWCPYCIGRGKTILDMQQLAAKKGGQCLSDTYVSSPSKLLWQCVKGHQWKAAPVTIGQGHWCPDCAGRTRLTIQQMHSLAQSRGGKCLSESYVSIKTPLLWQCSAGHRWKAAPGSVKTGSWCPTCARRSKPSIDDIQRVAGERGGKLLSQKYRNANAHLEWECNDGHQWKATWSHIRLGGWCPECSAGLGERICREFFSQLFQKPFPKTRPKWLINRAGNQMELDGYCAELSIAFEHQGEQHYSTKGYFIDSDFDLSRRQDDDARKSELCAQRGIALVAVPEIPDRLPLDQVMTFIKEQLAPKGISLPQDYDTQDVDINKAYRTGGSRETLKYLQSIARSNGGKCLSKEYANSQTNLLWECSKGHRWDATPNHIKQGQWCPFCIGRGKTIRDMQEIAAARGGKCLSPLYGRNSSNLLWQCHAGHQWQARPQNIIEGHWCPHCSRNAKLTIQEMHLLAETRGGRCLSDIYLGANSKLTWQCGKGHQWMSTPGQVRQGRWCRECSGYAKLTIEAMQQLAKSRGGKCLSAVYKDDRTKLLWECSKGHRWDADPNHIRRGHWCHYCAGQGKKTIDDMKILAAAHGGQCLTKTYKNTRTKLFWQCQAGHRWWTTPEHVQRGSWCPECWASRRGQSRRTGLPEMQSIALSRGGRCLSAEYVDAKSHLLWQCKDGHRWTATPSNIKGGKWCPIC